MFTHTTVGSNDIARSTQFYKEVLGALGHGFAGGDDNRAFFMSGKGPGAFLVMKPRDGQAATVGNGVTIGFVAASKEEVDAFHAAGLAQGGTDEGAPGHREAAPGNPYGAYLRDPDGNKICAFVRT